ncbi:MAG: glycosyltransferase [Actinomycetia bacterium]|nr:glycosyltransferase [Actinomycetes bacterium]
MRLSSGINVTVVGNYIPRQCGLATFTTDVAHWVTEELGPGSDVFVVAMNDTPEGYEYPPEVRFEVTAGNPRDYHRAADFINLSSVDIVCLQHEFGIFGGPRGFYITNLLRDLAKPVVTTLHTVLPDPESDRHEALAQVAELSDALVVMSRKSIDLLEHYYGISPEKVHFIHHGVPDMPFADPGIFKVNWGLQDKKVLLTFGLLHPRKGIEYMIEALPPLVERFPDIVYVVLGATHPPEKERNGERYRFSLKRRAREFGVEDHVIFYDRFVSIKELTEFLASCDVYITPYLDMNQIASGTLAYALGLGKPIVSTPYFYAQELLEGGRGILVPPRDPDSMAEAIGSLLSDDSRLEHMRHEAYSYGRQMIWKEVAREYVKLFQSVLAGSEPVPVPVASCPPISFRDLPKPKLDYFSRLTDKTGIIRKSAFDIPDRASGYSTDDNSMALAATVMYHLQTGDSRSLDLARIYLGFLKYMQLPDGRFRNYLSYKLTFQDEVGGEECQGRALAGLGLTIALEPDEAMASISKSMFESALACAATLSYARSLAYVIRGCYHYLSRFQGAGHVTKLLDGAASKLLGHYRNNAESGWRWFEPCLYYGNGMLSRALLLAFRATGNPEYRDVGLESLDFLTEQSYRDGIFDLVGDLGWYPKGGNRARFEQLPIEACSLVEAYVDTYLVERDDRYLELARAALEWFLGRNVVRQPLYDFASGGCSDGLLLNEVDPNRGASATIHFLLALLRMTFAVHPESEVLGQDVPSA